MTGLRIFEEAKETGKRGRRKQYDSKFYITHKFTLDLSQSQLGPLFTVDQKYARVMAHLYYQQGWYLS